MSGKALLTTRQRTVLRLLVEGKCTKEIAHELKLSARTVEQYRGLILARTKAGSIQKLIAKMAREGLTPADI